MEFESWMIGPSIAGGLLVIWVLINMKRSRPDGDFIQVHPVRRMIQFLMTSSNVSVVYFDSFVDADELLRYINDSERDFECGVTHCLVGACYTGYYGPSTYKMNRFVVEGP